MTPTRSLGGTRQERRVVKFQRSRQRMETENRYKCLPLKTETGRQLQEGGPGDARREML